MSLIHWAALPRFCSFSLCLSLIKYTLSLCLWFLILNFSNSPHFLYSVSLHLPFLAPSVTSHTFIAFSFLSILSSFLYSFLPSFLPFYSPLSSLFSPLVCLFPFTSSFFSFLLYQPIKQNVFIFKFFIFFLFLFFLYLSGRSAYCKVVCYSS